MVGRLSVDIHALNSFADNLDSIRRRMNATRDLFDSCDDAIGSHDVSSALDQFSGNWKDGRKKIDGNASKLVDAARGVADTLTGTDQQLARQLGQQTSTPDATRGSDGPAS